MLTGLWLWRRKGQGNVNEGGQDKVVITNGSPDPCFFLSLPNPPVVQGNLWTQKDDLHHIFGW